MVPESFESFFVATAGAGAAFIGLLFVAISIGPQRTFGPRAVAGALHQRLAEATLLTLANGFVISSIALIPGINLGWVVLAIGAAGALIGGHSVRLVARSHRHGSSQHAPWRHLLRVVMLSLVATVVYAIQSLLGLRLLLQPEDTGTSRSLAVLIISLYALGIERAWTLLGDPQHGWSGWLNSLQGLDAPSETDGAKEATLWFREPVPIRTRPGATASKSSARSAIVGGRLISTSSRGSSRGHGRNAPAGMTDIPAGMASACDFTPAGCVHEGAPAPSRTHPALCRAGS